MGTYSAKPTEVERRWYVVDATDQPLGRLATRVATVLRGKHRPDFTPHVDTGDFVIVVNAEKVKLTGSKLDQKMWQRHSGIPGGFKATLYRQLLATRPDFAIDKAVRGMLPKTSLGRKMRKKLKVYAGATHPHVAQKPEPLTF
jgi:large subunit ribosomal protein L13